MHFIHAFASVFIVFLLAGCSSTALHRSGIGEVCDLRETGAKNAPPGCERASIERSKNFDIAYVELTDQGWFHDRNELTDALRLLKPQGEKDLDIVVFVHGWKHSARFDDSDVRHFRDTVMPKLSRGRSVGIYVGWRGAALAAPLLEYATFYDRKSTADHVARGAVRELFAQLQAVRNDSTTGRKVRLTLIGHSFGGLIIFNAVAESLLNSLVLANHAATGLPRLAKLVADVILLLNPAFEASRFEPVFQVAKDQLTGDGQRSYSADQRPLLVSITSEADLATKLIFPLGRSVNSVFQHEGWTDQDDCSDTDAAQRQPAHTSSLSHGEQYLKHQDECSKANYAKRIEKIANTHTIGHMERYRTHQLSLATAANSSEPSLAIECKVSANPLIASANSFPLWNMFASKQVINGHHDIYQNKLWDFVSTLARHDPKLPGICH